MAFHIKAGDMYASLSQPTGCELGIIWTHQVGAASHFPTEEDALKLLGQFNWFGNPDFRIVPGYAWEK